jgi:hypothetical protein
MTRSTVSGSPPAVSHLRPACLLLVALTALVAGACVSERGEARGAPARRDAAAECERLAPDDPYQQFQAADSIDVAVASCQEALEREPDDAATLYRLGTSTLASDDGDNAAALESFRRADSLGYCEAPYFLGDYALKTGDTTSAEAFYARGAACGDPRAKVQVFSPDAFKMSAHPDFVAALYRGDVAYLNRTRFVTANYVAGFYETFSEQYLDEHFSTCWTKQFYRGGGISMALATAKMGDASNIIESTIYERALPWAYRLLVPGMGTTSLEQMRDAESKAGRADANRLIGATDCKSLVPGKVIAGIEAFARTPRSLYDVMQAELPNMHSIGDMTTLLQQANAAPSR